MTFETYKLPTIHRYLLSQFFLAFFGCLLAFVSLFLVFDLFDQMKIFIREGSSLSQAFAYLLLKIPLILHLMTPMAMLLATLISIGRLSQLSEVTAMRACGMSITAIAVPLLGAGLVVSFVTLITGETLVPWATQRMEEIYHIDIKKKAEKGRYSRENFWYRSGNRFFNIGFYDSRSATLTDVVGLEFGKDFTVRRRIDAREADWISPQAGWTMKDVVEMTFDQEAHLQMTPFRQLPLVIKEVPKDFYGMQRKPEEMSYFALTAYINKLRGEGVPVTKYLVDLAAKIAFPFVNVIAVLIAVPFALTPARSGTLTRSFIGGVSIGFAYHFTHALSTSLGSAELLPVLPSAWAANILFGCLGIFMLAGAEQAGT